MRVDFHKALTFLIPPLFLVGCGGGGPFPGMTADEVYNVGVQALLEEDWGRATQAFERVLLVPGFEQAAEARLQMAEAEYGRERYIESRAEFQRVIDRWPADSTAPHAALGVCRSLAGLSPKTQRDQTFTRQARTVCGQIAAEYAGTLVGLRSAEIGLEMHDKLAEHDYEVGLHYLKRGLVDSSILYFEDVVDDYPDSKWAAWALFKMIEAFDRIGYVQDIETHRQRLLADYPDSEPAKLIRDGGG